MGTSIQVTLDCVDPGRLADFWAEALGYKRDDPPEGFGSWEEWASQQGIPEAQWSEEDAIIDPAGLRPRLFFQRVPESKTVKDGVHLDLRIGTEVDVSPEENKKLIEQEAERLAALGTTVIGPVDRRDEYWVVMQDPEGNEFCVS
jgi:Glyoxalase-like domain